MGLLDDAIREHLELKRRRGADPGEIAHQERAALEPVFADEQAPAEDGAGHFDGAGQLDDGEHHEQVAAVQVEPAIAEPAAVEATGGHRSGSHEAHDGEEPPLAEFASPGQETAEIDMQAVLAEEESFDWEAPRRAEAEPIPEEVPGQERLSFE
jgi:hypothetical protein